MKKGILITIIVLLIICCAAGGAYYYITKNKSEENMSSNEKETEIEREQEEKKVKAKDVAEKLCLSKNSDMDSVKEFMLENMDFKAFLAYKKTNRGFDIEDVTTYEEYKKGLVEYFNKTLEKLTDEEVEEQRKDVEDYFDEYFKPKDDEELYVDSIGELKESFSFPAVDEMEVTYKNEDGDTYEYVFFFYNDKFVAYFNKAGRLDVEEKIKEYFDLVKE